LRRDALREGEADEGAPGGVGADERPLGVGLLYSLSGSANIDSFFPNISKVGYNLSARQWLAQSDSKSRFTRHEIL